MLQAIERQINQLSQSYVKNLEVQYKELNSIPNTIICLEYDATTFLIFRVNEANRGSIIELGFNNTELAIQCHIRHNVYIFTREHLEQLNSREYRDLFNQLGLTEFMSLFS